MILPLFRMGFSSLANGKRSSSTQRRLLLALFAVQSLTGMRGASETRSGEHPSRYSHVSRSGPGLSPMDYLR